jgi:hypothetical protein
MRNRDALLTKIFFSLVLLFSFIMCSEETNSLESEIGWDSDVIIGDYSNTLKDSSKSIAKLIQSGAGNLVKISPKEGSINFEKVYFKWGEAASDFYDAFNRYYYFYDYRLEIDDEVVWSTGNRTTTSCYLRLSGDGDIHTWQLYARFQYSGGLLTIGYNLSNYETWEFQVGMPSPTISSDWDDDSPQLLWKSVPNANVYLIYESSSSRGPWSLIKTTSNNNYTDWRYTRISPNITKYYTVKSGYGPWPYKCIASDYSNIRSFRVSLLE